MTDTVPSPVDTHPLKLGARRSLDILNEEATSLTAPMMLFGIVAEKLPQVIPDTGLLAEKMLEYWDTFRTYKTGIVTLLGEIYERNPEAVPEPLLRISEREVLDLMGGDRVLTEMEAHFTYYKENRRPFGKTSAEIATGIRHLAICADIAEKDERAHFIELHNTLTLRTLCTKYPFESLVMALQLLHTNVHLARLNLPGIGINTYLEAPRKDPPENLHMKMNRVKESQEWRNLVQIADDRNRRYLDIFRDPARHEFRETVYLPPFLFQREGLEKVDLSPFHYHPRSQS